ncbi:MAG: NADH-quinone oxidoreductase subunit K, partial [Bdellovibrionaceae bacterium]|nr:NADH-quinone oxidoreductase subunit K [Pseudobdellovibrionaceae bacterium]
MQSADIIGQIGLNHYLVLSSLLFVTGMAGVLLRRNVIV